MKKNYYTPQLKFHRLRLNTAIQAASTSEAHIGGGGSNSGGGFIMESKGYSSFDFDEDEE